MIRTVLFLLYDDRPAHDADRQQVFGRQVVPAILDLDPWRFWATLGDPESNVKSPAPYKRGERQLAGTCNVWLYADQDHRNFGAILTEAGFDWHAYRVDESVYTDYGDSLWAKPRDWPDGQRSPGVVAVTVLNRPDHIGPDEWFRRWQGRQSPVSEALQPRQKYVRNRVLEPLGHAPALAGVVQEVWPDRSHVSSLFKFFRARTPWTLAINIARMLASVTSFLELRQIRTAMAGEYLLKTGVQRLGTRT